jgi:hypothetical protein
MATWIVKASVGLLWKYPTIPGFMFIFYTIQIDIPGLIIAIQNSGERSYTLFWQAVQISVFMLSIGIAFANIVFHSNPKELERYFQSPVKLGKANWRLKSLMVLAFPVLLLLVAVYTYRVKEVPLFYMLAHPGDALQISLLRDESFKVLNVPDVELYMYAWIRELILPVMSGTAYIMWLLTRSPNWRNLFWLYLGLALFFASLSTAKQPVAVIFLLLALCYYLLFGIRRTLRYLPLFVLAVFIFPIFENYLKLGRSFNSESMYDIISFVFFERLLLIPASILSQYFDIFPLSEGFLLGRSIRLMSWLMGENFFNTANYVYLYLYPNHPIHTGLANAAFIGNLYADFGMPGVWLGSFLTGFILQSTQIFMMRHSKTAINLALYSFLCCTAWELISIPLPNVILGGGGALALLLVWMFDQLFYRSNQRHLKSRYVL